MASDGANFQPCSANPATTRDRSATIESTRTINWSRASNDATAATCARVLIPNGTAHLRKAAATGAWATAYPTRKPASP
ncbi:MAG: hypothetical protein BWY91_01661 [bacterium ADurb.BinA028]|nr:MAG: hypothetical protein BWY91_01661 [bacterium ADurb.BinA028]